MATLHLLAILQDTVIWDPAFALGHSRRNYGPDAGEFKPERWLRSDEGAVEINSTHSGQVANGEAGNATDDDNAPGCASSCELPDPYSFSVGSRDCIGRTLAMLELQMVLATLVGHFRIELPPDEAERVMQEGAMGTTRPMEEKVQFKVTMAPRGGLFLVATPRAAC